LPRAGGWLGPLDLSSGRVSRHSDPNAADAGRAHDSGERGRVLGAVGPGEAEADADNALFSSVKCNYPNGQNSGENLRLDQAALLVNSTGGLRVLNGASTSTERSSE